MKNSKIFSFIFMYIELEVFEAHLSRYSKNNLLKTRRPRFSGERVSISLFEVYVPSPAAVWLTIAKTVACVDCLQA